MESNLILEFLSRLLEFFKTYFFSTPIEEIHYNVALPNHSTQENRLSPMQIGLSGSEAHERFMMLRGESEEITLALHTSATIPDPNYNVVVPKLPEKQLSEKKESIKNWEPKIIKRKLDV
jgi:hypothetical protein